MDKHWNEETTQLNALGQLVVQAIVSIYAPGAGDLLTGLGATGTTVSAVTSYVVLNAAVESVINQVATAGVSAVITGELNLDVGELLSNAGKAAIFAGITDAIDQQYFTDKDGNLLEPNNMSFGEDVSKKVLHASASTLIYGGDFKDNIIAAVGDSVAAPAFNYIGHTLTGEEGLKLDPNDLSTQALITTAHGLVGGTVAKLTGGEFSSGAVATAVGHVVGEYAGKTLFKDYYNGTISESEFEDTLKALGRAVGGATALLTQEGVTPEELDRATALSESVIENNSIDSFIELQETFKKFGIPGVLVEATMEGLMKEEYSPKRDESGKVILNTTGDAVIHYFRGNGEAVVIGEETIKELQTSYKVVTQIEAIKNGMAKHYNGNLGVDLTLNTHVR